MTQRARRSKRCPRASSVALLLTLVVACGPGLTTPVRKGELLPGLGGLSVDEFSLSPDGAVMLLTVLGTGGFDLYRYELDSGTATLLQWPAELVTGGSRLDVVELGDAVWGGPLEVLVPVLGSFSGRTIVLHPIAKGGQAVVQSIGGSDGVRFVEVNLESPASVVPTDMKPKALSWPIESVTRLGPIEVRRLPREGLALVDSERSDRVLARHRYFGMSRLKVSSMAISSDSAIVAYLLSGARLGFVYYFLAVDRHSGQRWGLRPSDPAEGFAWHPTRRSLYAKHRSRLYVWNF